MPEPLIHFNVFDAMMRGTHRLTFIQIVLLFIIFCILGATCVWDVNPVSHRHRFLRFLLSLLTYSAFLSVVFIIWFYCFHFVIVQYLHNHDSQIHENLLRRWDLLTPESCSYGINSKCLCLS